MQARDETFGQLDFSPVRSVFSIVLTVFPVFLPVTKEGYTKIREADSVGFCPPVTITKIQIKKPKSKSGLNIFNYPRRQSLFPFLEEWGHLYGQSLRDSRILESGLPDCYLLKISASFWSSASPRSPLAMIFPSGPMRRVAGIELTPYTFPASQPQPLRSDR